MTQIGRLTLSAWQIAAASNALATPSSDGLMPKEDKARLDAILAEDQWIARISMLLSPTAVTLPATVNTATYLASNTDLAYVGIGSLKYADQARCVVDTRPEASTCYVYFEFSVDGGSTWTLEDGVTTSTAPSDAIAAGVVIQLANSLSNYRVFTVPASFKAAGDGLRVRLKLYDTTRTSVTQSMTRCEIQVKPNQIMGVPAATDAEITTGTSTDTKTVSPAQIKSAVLEFAPEVGGAVASVAGKTGVVTLDQDDVAGVVPTTRTVTAGNGLTGGGDLSTNRSLAANFTSAGGDAGTATTVARGDHTHAAATTSVKGLLAAADKTKLDGIAAGAQVNPPTMSDATAVAGTDTTTSTVTAAQLASVARIYGASASGTVFPTATTSGMRFDRTDLSIRFVRNAANTFWDVEENYGSTGTPNANNDANIGGSYWGYKVGSLWWNKSTGALYRCVNNSDGAAVWVQIGGGGSSYSVATESTDGLMSSTDKTKLNGIDDGAQVNPTAATDLEITTGTLTDTRTVSPAQIKTAITTFAPEVSTDGLVPDTTNVLAGSGLTGGGALSADVSLAVNLTSSGGNNGVATTVARGDHKHALATSAADGFMPKEDKSKLDSASALAKAQLFTATVAGNIMTWTANGSWVSNQSSGGIRAQPSVTTDVGSFVWSGIVAGSQMGDAGSKFLLMGMNEADGIWRWLNGEAITMSGNNPSAPPSVGITNAAVYPVAADSAGEFYVEGVLPTALKGAKVRFDIVLSPSTNGVLTLRSCQMTGVVLAAGGSGGGGGTALSTTQERRLSDSSVLVSPTAEQISNIIDQEVRRGRCGRYISVHAPLVLTSVFDKVNASSAGISPANSAAANDSAIEAVLASFGAGGGAIVFDPQNNPYKFVTPIRMRPYVQILGRPGYEEETILHQVYDSESTAAFQRALWAIHGARFQTYGRLDYTVNTRPHKYRRIKDVVAGQDYVEGVASSDVSSGTGADGTTSVGAVVKGDIVCIYSYLFITDHGFTKPRYVMHNIVDRVSGNFVYLRYPIPWTTSQGDPDTDPVHPWTGNRYLGMIRCSEVDLRTSENGSGDTVTTTGTWPSSMNGIGNAVPSHHNSWQNITMRSDGRLWCVGLPFHSTINSCVMEATGTIVGGNLMQGARITDCLWRFGRAVKAGNPDPGNMHCGEWAMGSFDNEINGAVFEPAGSIAGRNLGSPLLTFNENSQSNRVRRLKIKRSHTYALDNGVGFDFFKIFGPDTLFEDIEIEHGNTAGGRIFWLESYGGGPGGNDTEFGPHRLTIRRVKFTRQSDQTDNGKILHMDDDLIALDGLVEQLCVTNNGSDGNAQFIIGNNASGWQIRDSQLRNAIIDKHSGATDIELLRVFHNGTPISAANGLTTAGTAPTIIDGTPNIIGF